MKKLAMALALVLGLSTIVHFSAPVSFAQEEPAPQPEKPEKPDRD